MNQEALNPIELFQECLQNPEPLIDRFYCLDELIISKDYNSTPTPIMLTNADIIKRITAADVALEDKEQYTYLEQVKKIKSLLEKNSVNFIEFTSFWPCFDVSFSSYEKYLSSSEQVEFLKEIIELYIKKRHRIYTSHGYTPTTIQVRKDFEKHKTSGPTGFAKAEKFLKDMGFKKYENIDFIEKNKVYCAADRGQGKKIIDSLKKKFGMRFSWQDAHQKKKPDLIFKGTNKRVFIAELKHMKEAGGGQDKQMSELISLIKEGEDTKWISYVAYLDGVYFNKLISPNKNKIREQKEQIIKYLKENSANPNYFVNTYGLSRIISSVSGQDKDRE
jgi:hypothetical protein